MKRFLWKLAKQPLSLLLIGLLTFSTVWLGDRLSPAHAIAPSQSLTSNHHSNPSASHQAEQISQILLPIPTQQFEDLTQHAPPDPRLAPIDGMSGAEIADMIDRDYPRWTESLPICPCTVAEAQKHPKLRDASADYLGAAQLISEWFHPGAAYDFRQRSEKLQDYPSPTNSSAIPIRPGQQCIYDSNGDLINRGPGAGTPDIFGPEGTDNLSYHHDSWDVETYKEIIEKHPDGLDRYHQTWKPSLGQDNSGATCKLNPPAPQKRTGKRRRGRNFGDPHLFTYDGQRYSFQQVGEFILSRSDDGLFEIQVRQSPVNSALSVDSAVAMNIAGQRVALYADGGPSSNPNQPLFINGQPATVAKEQPLGNGGRIFRKGHDYGFEWPTGEELIVQLNQTSDNPFLNITAYVFESQANHLEGLLGNGNGDAKDDLRFRNGTVLASQNSYGDLKKLVTRISPVRLPLDAGLKHYLKRLTKDYGNDWRVSPAESLFDYAPGQSTTAFTLNDFPSEYLALAQLSSNELNQARKTCASGNVEAELMEGCVFDVAFSGRGEFAKATARIREVSSLLRDFGIPVPDLEQELRRRIRLPWSLKLPKLPF